MKLITAIRFSQAILLSLFFLVCAQPTRAESVDSTFIKFDLGGIGPDITYLGGIFGTVDDGDSGTLGDQNTEIDYTGFLSGLPDILAGASFSLDDVASVGNASVIGSSVFQQTDGGTLSIYDSDGSLLLSGELGEGEIAGSTSASTGSFFNTEFVNFTGGSLLAFVLPFPGGVSLALASIATGSETGLRVIDGVLQSFDANANGLVTGSAVPEPTSIAMLLTGMIGLGLGRSRISPKS